MRSLAVHKYHKQYFAPPLGKKIVYYNAKDSDCANNKS